MANVKHDGLRPLLTDERFSSKEGELIITLPNKEGGVNNANGKR
jgi:hypothetical protein